MSTTRRTFLAAVGMTATVGLAGCAGGDGGDGDGGGTGTRTPTETETETETEPGNQTGTDGEGATVAVTDHPELGEILVDAEGMSLYMFDSDTQGAEESTCYDGCAEAWPPLIAEEPTAGEGVTAELTTFEREDGEMQVAAAGWPLYYFASDEEPGDVAGQGVNDVWWVLAPDGTPIKPDASGGGNETNETGGDNETTESTADPY